MKSHDEVSKQYGRNQDFSYLLHVFLLDDGRTRIRTFEFWLTEPDTGGQNTYGSGSGTLL